jgi:hypothetical protein
MSQTQVDPAAAMFHSVYQCDPTGGSRATSGPRPLVTRPANLFVDLLLQPHLFSSLRRIGKNIVILISSAALRTSATHATDFKTLPFNVSFSGKNCQIQTVAGANLK